PLPVPPVWRPAGSALRTACWPRPGCGRPNAWACTPCSGRRGAGTGDRRPHPTAWWRTSWPGSARAGPSSCTIPTAPRHPSRGARPWAPCPPWPRPSGRGAWPSGPWPSTASPRPFERPSALAPGSPKGATVARAPGVPDHGRGGDMIEKERGGTGMTVRFRIPGQAAAESASVLGDFNDWSPSAHEMVRDEDGFVVEIVLPPGRSYRFRYLLDGHRWENDWAADAYVP